VTRRIYALTDDQKTTLLSFVLSPSPADSPLPILGDGSNRIRVDAHNATEEWSIFRNQWERAPNDTDTEEYWARRPQKEIDYPELQVERQMMDRLFGDSDGEPESGDDNG
jgi:hypothetical protein